jgi:DNA-binding NtrC family response regulator
MHIELKTMNKILCIEDDLDIADVLELALGDLYDLKIITHTKQLIETLLAFMPDLILIDNFIGTVRAAEVMKEIKSSLELENIPFILCSGHADIKTIALEISATAYLEKPFDLVDLYAVIHQTLLVKPIM